MDGPYTCSLLQVRAIVMENMGGDAKVADYLKANGDDKAEFSEMGFDSLGTCLLGSVTLMSW